MFYAEPLSAVEFRCFEHDVSVSEVLFFMQYLLMASAPGRFDQPEGAFPSGCVTFIQYTSTYSHTHTHTGRLFFTYLQIMTYLHLLHCQPDSIRRKQKQNNNKWTSFTGTAGQLADWAPALRARAKVASFLCDLQSALQILVKQLTP